MCMSGRQRPTPLPQPSLLAPRAHCRLAASQRSELQATSGACGLDVWRRAVWWRRALEGGSESEDGAVAAWAAAVGGKVGLAAFDVSDASDVLLCWAARLFVLLGDSCFAGCSGCSAVLFVLASPPATAPLAGHHACLTHPMRAMRLGGGGAPSPRAPQLLG